MDDYLRWRHQDEEHDDDDNESYRYCMARARRRMVTATITFKCLSHFVGFVDFTAQTDIKIEQEDEGNKIADHGPDYPISRVDLSIIPQGNGIWYINFCTGVCAELSNLVPPQDRNVEGEREHISYHNNTFDPTGRQVNILT
ncbi:hypothetical protein SNE40_008363 [Patella caerulea]|uniref:Uncharacterized protein n=1 Tax=Patella caerulea TaxID=87958 RepID=A0AAN8PWG5_PATCE